MVLQFVKKILKDSKILRQAAVAGTAKDRALFRADTGLPVARLRPTGKGDGVEVMWWSHRDRWDQIRDFWPMVLPLEDALTQIARDPMGCFWHRAPGPAATAFHHGVPQQGSQTGRGQGLRCPAR